VQKISGPKKRGRAFCRFVFAPLLKKKKKLFGGGTRGGASRTADLSGHTLKVLKVNLQELKAREKLMPSHRGLRGGKNWRDRPSGIAGNLLKDLRN